MIIDVTVPVLAESVPDATLISWNKAVGEPVVSGEILIEVETDKVVLEVVAPNDGILSEILRPDGDTVLSGEVLARIDTEGVATATSSAPSPAAAPAQAAVSAPPTAPAPAAQPAGSDDSAQSPAVRKLVAEHRLDPSAIAASGKGGRLTKGDVLAFIEQRAANPAPPVPATPTKAPAPVKATPAPVPGSRGEHREPMSRLRQRIAERLVHAQQTAAILTTFNEVNMAPVMELRTRYKESFEKTYGVRLGFMSFFAKAAVQALRRYPAVNAYIDGKEIVYHDFYDVGVAVGSPRGLVVPILRNVEAMTFADIERAVTDFGERARDGSLSIEDMTGGTFTISNGGVFGSLLSTPILNPPQSAILGMHKTQERPMA
ncbi:MAG: 2-oxoglutarate dehydrogenase E2 component (dihydrolipoamide succinyltransferase), partial [Gammaproteobacteria bacterium]